MSSPADWLDLRDDAGRISHQKLVLLGFLVIAILFHAIGIQFSWWELVVLGSIACGPRMFGLFLRRSSFSFGGTPTALLPATDDPPPPAASAPLAAGHAYDPGA